MVKGKRNILKMKWPEEWQPTMELRWSWERRHSTNIEGQPDFFGPVHVLQQKWVSKGKEEWRDVETVDNIGHESA